LAPLEVAKTVYQVLTAANPRLRYIVAENKLEYQMMKILPASYVDKLALKKVQKVVKLAHVAVNHSK
jgi:D-alanyl-D-alanine dipeptidase